MESEWTATIGATTLVARVNVDGKVYDLAKDGGRTLKDLGWKKFANIDFSPAAALDVRTPGGKVFTLEWKESLTVRDIKRELSSSYGLPLLRIALYLDDAKENRALLLEDHRTLGSYGIAAGRTLDVAYLGRGTPVWVKFPGTTAAAPPLRTLIFIPPELDNLDELREVIRTQAQMDASSVGQPFVIAEQVGSEHRGWETLGMEGTICCYPSTLIPLKAIVNGSEMKGLIFLRSDTIGDVKKKIKEAYEGKAVDTIEVYAFKEMEAPCARKAIKSKGWLHALQPQQQQSRSSLSAGAAAHDDEEDEELEEVEGFRPEPFQDDSRIANEPLLFPGATLYILVREYISVTFRLPDGSTVQADRVFTTSGVDELRRAIQWHIDYPADEVCFVANEKVVEDTFGLKHGCAVYILKIHSTLPRLYLRWTVGPGRSFYTGLAWDTEQETLGSMVQKIRSAARDIRPNSVHVQKVSFNGSTLFTPEMDEKEYAHKTMGNIGVKPRLTLDVEGRWVDPSEEEFSIFVRILGGNLITIVCSYRDTIQTIHEQLLKRNGFPIDQQRLIYKGKQLEADRTLADYRISSESTIHLALRLRGT